MTDVAHILGEFITAWNAGRRPSLPEYLERVPPADRDELAEQIETFLLVAPEPEYDEATWAEMTTSPTVASVAAASMEPDAPLATLRERAGLSVAQLAERLGFSGRQREKAAGYLEDIEAGRRPPSRSLLGRLREILGERAGWSEGFAAGAMGVARATVEPAPHIDVLADAALSDDDEYDEVDELFLED